MTTETKICQWGWKAYYFPQQRNSEQRNQDFRQWELPFYTIKLLIVDFREDDDAVTAELYGGALELLRQGVRRIRPVLLCEADFPRQNQAEHKVPVPRLGGYWTPFLMSSRAQRFPFVWIPRSTWLASDMKGAHTMQAVTFWLQTLNTGIQASGWRLLKTLQCHWWLHGGLLYTICDPWVILYPSRCHYDGDFFLSKLLCNTETKHYGTLHYLQNHASLNITNELVFVMGICFLWGRNFFK